MIGADAWYDVLDLGSPADHLAFPHTAVHVVSKGKGSARASWLDLGDHGVKVSTVSPGSVGQVKTAA